MRKSKIVIAVTLSLLLLALLVPTGVSAAAKMKVTKTGVTNICSGNTFYFNLPKNKTGKVTIHADDNDPALVWKVKVWNTPTNYSKTYTIKRTNASNNMNAYLTIPKKGAAHKYGIKVTVSKGSFGSGWYTFRAYRATPSSAYYSGK